MYDFFISFKCTYNSKKTKDYEIAQDLSKRLTEKGFAVFYSETVLEQNGTAEYIVEINKALTDSRVLILICSDIEYITTGWVLQEWCSFLNLMMTDKTRKMFTYLIDVETKDLPPLLGPFQSFRHEDGISEAIKYIAQTRNDKKCPDSTYSLQKLIDQEFGIFGHRTRKLNETLLYEKFHGIEMYECIMASFFQRIGEYEKAFGYINNLIKKESIEGGYWASLFARRGYLSEKNAREANRILTLTKTWWIQKYRIKNNNSNILLLVFEKNGTILSSAEFMCASIFDILKEFGIDIDIMPLNKTSDISDEIFQYEYILLLSNSVNAFEDDYYDGKDVIKKLLSIPKEKLKLGIQSISIANISKEFRKYSTFELEKNGISKYCKFILDNNVDKVLGNQNL